MKKSRSVVVILLLAMLLVLAGCITKTSPELADETNVGFTPQLVNAKIGDAVTGEGVSILSGAMTLKADDRVWVIIETSGKSLADHYLDEGISGEFSSYALTAEAQSIMAELTSEQAEVMSLVKALDEDVEFSHQYTALLSGFAAEVRYGEISAIEALPNVERVVVSEEYAQLETSAEDVLALMQETGIFENNTDYKGEGMLIAVLDNGLDYDHSAFQTIPEVQNLKYSDVENLVNGIWGVTSKGKTFTAAQIYKSGKVPFQFDYAGVDADVKTNSTSITYYGTYHGTHVSGIIAGNDDTIQGSAPEAQLAFMKVFGDYATGGKTTDIVAALGDCAYLGVDALNMSLGSVAGFTYERSSDLYYVNTMYAKLEQLGILVCCAAGNETNTSYTYSDLSIDAGNPDMGLISSPGSYDAAFAVASNDREATGVFYADGSAVTYEVPVNPDSVAFDIESMLYESGSLREFDLVVVPGYGEDKDYEGLDVEGKAVLVVRGETTLEAKQVVAANHGAALCIIYNNASGIIRAQMNDVVIPTVTVQLLDGNRLLTASKVTFEEGASVNMISSFSSWGPLSDLTLKPDITAPGGSIYSSMPDGYNGGSYAYLSGTSMATPNLTGIISVVKQYVRANFPAATELEIRNLCYQLIQSTATQLVDEGGNLASPRAQGAGVANVNNATTTTGYLWVTGSSRTKLELGDDKNRDGIYTLKFNVTNFGSTTLSYRADVATFTETLNPDGETLALRSYLLNKGSVEVKSEALTNGLIVLDAGETASVTIVITLSDEEKAYLDDSFENGMYIEGFAFLRAEEGTDIDLSIPFLGFYGDWTQAPIFDVSAYDGIDPAVYGSTVYGWYGTYGTYYPMGTYEFFVPEDGAEIPEASYDRIALTCDENGVYKIYAIYLADFRNISYIEYNLWDEESGFNYYTYYDYNVKKMYYSSSTGGIVVAGHALNIYATIGEYDFSSNQRLVLSVDAYLDVDGEYAHSRIEFPVILDFEKPVLQSVEVREENGRTYVDMEVYDNHIVDHLLLATPQANSSVLNLLKSNATPVVDFAMGQTNKITVDVTDLIPDMYEGKFYVAFEDCAMNQAIYYIGQFGEEAEEEAEENALPTSYDYQTVKEWLEDVKGYDFSDERLEEEVVTAFILSEMEALSYEAVINDNGSQVYTNGDHQFTVDANGQLIKYEGPGGEVEIPGDIGIKSIAGTTAVFRANTAITKVIIPDGVVSLGNTCFYQASNLTEVVLPSSIKTYGSNCFRASGLIECEIPEGAETLGSSIFCECRSLEKVTFPQSAAKGQFPAQAIAWSTKLTEFYMPDGYTTTGSQPFTVCTSLKKLRLATTLTSTVNFFASSCWVLEEVNTEELTKVTSWGQSTFSHCDLRNVILPENENGAVVTMNAGFINGNMNLESFVCYAHLSRFNTVTEYDNPKLTKLEFHGDVDGVIAGTNFTGAPNLETIVFYGNVNNIGNNYEQEFSFSNNGIKSIHFYGNVGQIGGTNFSNCPNLEEVVFHKNIGTINAFPFGNCPKLKNFSISEDNEYLVFDEETKIVYNKEMTKMYVPSGWDYDGVLEIPETVTSLEKGQFGAAPRYLERAYMTYTYTESVVSGTGSLIHPNNNEVKPLLKGVIIPETITTIPEYAFRGFTGMKTVEFKGEVRSIDKKAFENCGIEELVLPDSLTTIGQYAFNNNQNLKSVVFGAKTATINTYAFADCTSLTNVEFNEGLTSVLNYAFQNTAIESLNIPASVSSFNPLTVLDGVYTLKTIEVAEDNRILASVDNVLFNKGMTTLYDYNIASDRTEYTVPASVIDISAYAFHKAESLNKIELSNVQRIYNYAFFGSGINNVTLPDTINYIGTRAFAELDLNTLTISDGTSMFDYAYVLRNTAIDNVVIANNQFFAINDCYVMSKDGRVIYDYIGGSVETLVLPEGVTRIAPFAFKDADIKNVVLPETLKSIGASAFYGTSLETVTFKSVKAPRFECEYNDDATFFYSNFGDFDVTTAPTIRAICPANATYLNNYIFKHMFNIAE